MLVPGMGAAQNASLEALLESQLSGDGRVVEIDGFAGALSRQASLEALRISDADGLWLELEDVSLDWNRSALLGGRLEVVELRAGRIAVMRAPVAEDSVEVPSAEASGFTVPDLPVAIEIERVVAEEIFLGAPLLGEDVTATAELSARLVSGALELSVDARRTDAQPGEAQVAFGYEPEGAVLSLDLAVSEPEGGVLARALDLPGLPSVGLTLAGAGPLDAFEATLSLATDGQERFGGTVTLAGAPSADGVETDPATQEIAFTADLSGDLRPLLDAETAAFFGAETALRARGTRQGDGVLILDQFEAGTEALDLRGQARLDAGGAPAFFDVTGDLRGPVQLPGSTTRVDGATLAAQFDAARSDAWALTADVAGVDTGDVTVAGLSLRGTGVIQPGGETPFTGALQADVAGFEMASQPGLAPALGEALNLSLDLSADADGSLRVDALEAEAGPVALTGDATLAFLDGAAQVVLRADATLSDLAPFSTLADRPLAGRGDITLSAQTVVPGGTFSLSLDAVTEGLSVDIPDLTPLLQPKSTLSTAIARDETGTRVERFAFDNPELTATLSGDVSEETGVVDLAVNLREVALFTDVLSGPVTLAAVLQQPTSAQIVNATLEAEGLRATVGGALAAPGDALDLDITLDSLGQFAPGLSGGAALTAAVEDLQGSPNITATLRTDTGATADLNGEVFPNDGTVAMTARGTAPLALAERFLEGRSIGGDVSFDLSVNGQPSLAALSGRVSSQNARFFDPDIGITLSPITLDARLAGGRATADVQAFLEGVPINLSADAGLTAPFPIDATLRATRLPVAYEGVFTNSTSLDLRIEGRGADRVAVSGTILLDDNEVRIPDTGLGGGPDIPAMVHVGADPALRRTLARAGLPLDAFAAAQAAAGPGIDIPLDLQITAVSPVFLRGRGIDAGFDGSLTIVGSAAVPVAVGELALTRGRMDFLGRRLELTDGRITLLGSLVPQMLIVAETVVEDVTARIALSGPVDAPELSLSSTPELPEDEVLARVLFGRGIETLSGFQVARLLASLRTLSGAGGAGILENARESLGVDDVDLRTDNETGETSLAVGQTISDGVYSEVEVNSNGSTTVTLNFDLTDTTSLRGSASSEGETGLGIFWQRDY